MLNTIADPEKTGFDTPEGMMFRPCLTRIIKKN